MTPTRLGFGLATAVSWGSADFLGGSASRRTTPLAAVVGAGLPVIAGAVFGDG